MDIFEQHESAVRSYCRSWPTVFQKAKGDHLWDEAGTQYLDFFAGAGALNYGHNPEPLKRALLDYIENDGVTHSLDTHTTAKAAFLERLHEVVLEPRGMDHKVMFPGPTGTNAVEAALKLARKVTGRDTVVSFTNAFHGMTLGSLAITGNSMKRQGAGVPLGNAISMPYDSFLEEPSDSIGYLESFIEDGGSGMELPALVILETVQAEGGINVASFGWLQRLSELCKRHGILLAVDDIQVGCGRTGPFFSFEPAGITPDIICLSKSLSGYGLPLAVTLMRPDLDVWAPGEHNGTFRGHNPAFVTATAALDNWTSDDFSDEVKVKSQVVGERLTEIAGAHPEMKATVRGRGLIQGLAFEDPSHASRIARACFEEHLLIETAGPDGEVLKLLPPLTVTEEHLEQGLDIVAGAVEKIAAGVEATEPEEVGR
ncbi:diaminobutyrate--2-oxoglutarate transaminase [Actinomarinicola tropica]|uniref:Diaminobutyrate--2-oxoglutarate transaminase n=1 Tax=Actinomarinicola tropica TaxID=2789776 RepID=A0A5Q2RNL0_9ACTN|nr:diaminobutyrate--2-oxoglutarate transaminase [Actinomarinicola tropica]QGG96532.1 diaminobutyrate--2-oxoglutarate transaminase [Actinomarinicola tropica]